ncbi:hypothetical protein K474DRAFT_1530592 [Panus rudis PR-1116 ss-1]|nr:hypothetical protein K474DRAFT_1530592 [Panus rudis PR-1116 ss-1]
MGTKGYIHRKRIASEIPREPEAFQRWLAATRKALDQYKYFGEYSYEESEDDESSEDDAPSVKVDPRFYAEMGVTKELDEDGLDCTIFFMDLDNLAFTRWPSPIFRLDHMPPRDVFLRCCNGHDHYDNDDCARDTPQEYRFSYSSPPPKADAEMQTMYLGHQAAQPVVPVAHLLSRSEALSSQEATRVRLLEVAVAAMMTMYPDAVVVQKASGLKDRDSLPPKHIGCCSLLVQLAVNPSYFVFGSRTKREVPPCCDTHEWWIRKHICVSLTTHLNDEDNLRDSVARVVQKVLARDGPDVTYGVAFDLLRIVIIRVDRQTKKFTHTEALQFTPSRYAESPSTPGIEALARLGNLSSSREHDTIYYLNHYYIAHKDSGKRRPKKRRPRKHGKKNGSLKIRQLPVEIWACIASFVEDGADLTNLALSSSKIASAALPYLKYPQVSFDPMSADILRSPSNHVFRPSMTNSTRREIIYELTAAPFTTAANTNFCVAADQHSYAYARSDEFKRLWPMIGDVKELRCNGITFKFRGFAQK